MSLVEDMHAAHKARLVRLGARPAQSTLPPRLSIEESGALLQQLEKERETVKELSEVIARQRELIMTFAGEGEVMRPRMADIIAVVAEYYNISTAILCGFDRSRNVVLPRQITYYLGRESGYALTVVGAAVGDRDHSTVHHGVERIQALLLTDAVLENRLKTIRGKIFAHACRRVELSKAALA